MAVMVGGGITVEVPVGCGDVRMPPDDIAVDPAVLPAGAGARVPPAPAGGAGVAPSRGSAAGEPPKELVSVGKTQIPFAEHT